MTTAERRLWQDGHGDQVIGARRLLDRTLEEELRVHVETTLLREVGTILTARCCADDTAAHVFLLSAADADGGLSSAA